jgi:hypothetical protein
MTTSPDALRAEPRTTVGPFVVDGTPFVIESNRPEMAAAVDARLRDLRTESPSGTPVVYTVDHQGPTWHSHPWGVWRDGQPCWATLAPSSVVPYVLWQVTRLVLENVGTDVPVHAAAVTWGDKAVVLAGRPHVRTSTLTAWLLTKGWGFLSDDVAIIDPSGDRAVVRPFWRPIGIGRGGPLDDVILPGDADNPALVPASLLGERAPATRLAAVVLPAYRPGHAQEPQPMTPAETLVALTEHLPLRREQGRRSFQAMAGVADSVPGFNHAVDDLDVADAHLRALVGGVA